MADALKIALILTAVDKASAITDKAFKKMNAGLKGIDKSKAVFNKIGNYATIAGGAVLAAFIPAIHAAEENEVAVKRLEQVYRSMGQNVEEASKQSQAYASKLEFQIGIEDEAIMAVQAKLATFSKVSDETHRMTGFMDRATAAAFDLASTGFGDAAANATMLGKALQNPALGAAALSKAGALNKADIPIIKQIQATKGLAAAQEFVLKAVEKQVKGVAAATTTASDKARVGWSEVTESLGKVLLPTFTKIIDKVNEIIPRIQAWVEENSTLVMWITGISTAVLAVGVALKVMAFGISTIQTVGKALGIVTRLLMANPIILIIAAIAAAAYLIYDNWDAIVQFFSDLWDGVKAVFSALWGWVKKIFWDNSPAVLIYDNWGAIVDWFQNLWNNVTAKFWQFIGFLKSIPSMFLQLGKDFVNGIWQGMKSVWNDLMDWFSGVWNDIKAPFEWLFGGGGTADLQKKQTDAVFNANNKFSNTVAPVMGNATPSYNSTKTSSQLQYAPVYNLSGTATKEDAQMLNNLNQKTFDKMMQQNANQKQRTGFN